MSERVAFIPARKGSKRVPGKNMRLFHGRPLAEWTLDLAKTSGLFDRIVVSTDDSDLAAAAPRFGATLCRRPETLANETATVIEVIRQVGDELHLANDAAIAVLLVTGPLRVPSDLTEGFRLFEAHGRKRCVMSVSKNPTPPALLWELAGDGALVSLAQTRDATYTRKQGHAATYFSNDILVLDTLAAFRVPGRPLFGHDPVALMVPPERCMPIDEPYQFRLAELLFPPTDERAEISR